MKLIKNARIITMDAQRRAFDDGAVAIAGSRIEAVGERQALERRYPEAETIDAGGMLLIPGLINAHTHIYQVLYKGLGDDAALSGWLKKCVYPMSLNLTGQDCYHAMKLSAVEMIRGGTTTFVDCHYMNRDLSCQDYLAQAVTDSGIRGVLGRGTIDAAPAPEPLRESVAQAVAEAERVIAATADSAATEFECSVACIGATTCQQGVRDSQGVLQTVVQAVREANIPDGALPRICISGCPSSCAAHEAGTIGFQGGVRLEDKKPQPAFRMFLGGSDALDAARFGEAGAVILERDIPALLVELGRVAAAAGQPWEQWAETHREELNAIVARYA